MGIVDFEKLQNDVNVRPPMMQHQATRLKAHVLAQQVGNWAGWTPIKGLSACTVRPKRAASCAEAAADMRNVSCILVRGGFLLGQLAGSRSTTRVI